MKKYCLFCLVLLLAVGCSKKQPVASISGPQSGANPVHVEVFPTPTTADLQVGKWATPPDEYANGLYSNFAYNFSLPWPSATKLYFTNYQFDDNGGLNPTPGSVAANGSLTHAGSTGNIFVQVTKFTDYVKSQEASCAEELKLNPGMLAKNCRPEISQEQILAMRKSLLSKKFSSSILLPGDKQNVVPEFITLKGGVGVLAVLFSRDSGTWGAHFVTLNKNNDYLEFYLSSPEAKSREELIVLPQYKEFQALVSKISL